MYILKQKQKKFPDFMKNFVDFEKIIGNLILFADFIKKFADFLNFKNCYKNKKTFKHNFLKF